MNIVALDGKGVTLYKIGDYLEALQSQYQAFNIHHQFPGLLDNIGFDFYEMGDNLNAITAFDAALSVNQTDTHALDNLAAYLTHLEIDMKR